MTTLQCRLCSSTRVLLSMSNGKSKLTRKYIQSLTSYTIGIKFEKHDLRQSICYNCIVQVYNYYVFKMQTLENEKKLQATLSKNTAILEETSQEDTDNMKLPSIDELKQTLLPWLLSKENSNTDLEQDEDKVKHTFVQTDLSSLNMVNTHSQCDIQVIHHKNEMADKQFQTSFDYHLQKKDISCQTDLPTSISQGNYGNTRAIVETADVSSQTDCVQYRTTEVQTISRGRKRKNGSISSSLEQKNGNNGDVLRKKCRPKIIKSRKNGLKEYYLADIMELKDVSKIHFNKSDNIDPKTKGDSTKELLPNAKLKTTFDIQIAAPLPKTLCTDLQSQKYLSPKSTDSLPVGQVCTKEFLPNAEVKTDLDKKTTLSKTLCIEQQSQNYLSPRSSGLLSVKDKVEYVQICTLCDMTLYSKNEMRSHWRKHLKCRYCQLRFTSLKKVKLHMASECEKRVILKVPLVRMEEIENMKAKYPHIVQVLGGKRKRSDSST